MVVWRTFTDGNTILKCKKELIKDFMKEYNSYGGQLTKKNHIQNELDYLWIHIYDTQEQKII